MALLKQGVSYGKVIVSKMVFSCTKCEHIDVITENNYDPSVEVVCSKCNGIMLLSSTSSASSANSNDENYNEDLDNSNTQQND